MRTLLLLLLLAPQIASAQSFTFTVPTVRVNMAPPAVRVEVQPPRPTAGHVWIAGHWAWRNNAHVWFPGQWVIPPGPGFVWEAAHWKQVGGGGWEFLEGHWRQNQPPAQNYVYQPVVTEKIIIQQQPPPNIAEVKPPAPYPGWAWIGGHWQWTGNTFAWVGGHWSGPPRQGAVWVNAHWERNNNNSWQFHGGHWD